MQVDWVTVVAQIVNFLVLVLLLRRFLYRPVLDAMDRRQRSITEKLEEARRREREAGERSSEYDRRLAELERGREEALGEARRAAEKERRELLERAREEVSEAERRWREELRREQEVFLRDLEKDLARDAQAVARRCLSDLVDADLEERMVGAFLARLEGLGREERAALVSGGELAVATAFPLDDRVRERISASLADGLGPGVPIRFAPGADLVCGIELRSGERRVGWSVAEYLETVEERVRERLRAAAPAEAAGADAA